MEKVFLLNILFLSFRVLIGQTVIFETIGAYDTDGTKYDNLKTNFYIDCDNHLYFKKVFEDEKWVKYKTYNITQNISIKDGILYVLDYGSEGKISNIVITKTEIIETWNTEL